MRAGGEARANRARARHWTRYSILFFSFGCVACVRAWAYAFSGVFFLDSPSRASAVQMCIMSFFFLFSNFFIEKVGIANTPPIPVVPAADQLPLGLSRRKSSYRVTSTVVLAS